MVVPRAHKIKLNTILKENANEFEYYNNLNKKMNQKTSVSVK